MTDGPEDFGLVEEGYFAAGWWSTTETLQTRVNSTAVQDPTKVAAVDGQSRRMTYAQLDRESDLLAIGLTCLGIHQGDVVGVQLPNRVEAVLAMCAIEKLGGVVTPLMPMYREKELKYISRVGGMKAVFVPGEYRGVDHDRMAATLLTEGYIDQAVTLSGNKGGSRMHQIDEVIILGQDARSNITLPILDPQADAALMFTSGTTGSPKGVLHSHNTLLAGNRTLSEQLDLSQDDSIFVPAVVGHGTGYVWGIRFALFLGATAVLLDRWDPELGAAMLAEQRCSWMMVAPTFVQDLLDANERSDIDISSLRYLSCGGAAPASHLHERVLKELGCQLLRLYGQTEAFLSTHCLPIDPLEKLMNTEGAALPGVELRAIQADGEAAATGQSGELWARGPHRCVALLTEEGSRRLDPSEWIASGDLASIDEEGFLSVRGRIKEFINRGGFKYSPVEVEDILHRHPAIARVAIVAIPDERLGERGCACVIPRMDAPLSLADITDFLREAGMAPFKWPERLVLFDELPLTPSGKIQKHLLQDSLADEPRTDPR